jgi:hypothetical protein
MTAVMIAVMTVVMTVAVVDMTTVTAAIKLCWLSEMRVMMIWLVAFDVLPSRLFIC